MIADDLNGQIKDVKTDNTPGVGGNDCMGCMLCLEKCPEGAIFIKTENGFDMPMVDSVKCIKCGQCNRICPVNAPQRSIEPKDIYALCDRDENRRLAASSGGAFGMLAKMFIDKGGAVAGVAYDENMNPVHRIAHTPEEILSFHGSKYVQSSMVDIYKQLETELKKGKPVLASGTPCQIAAIKTYFGDKCDNLYTVDLICHGVQSPVIFREYINSLEDRYKKNITDFKFRDKTHGWKKSNVKVIFEDNSDIIMTRVECELFNYFDYLRGSCYKCHFRNFNNYSDITIGDYWGVETLTDKFSDDKGASIALIHTDKGREMFGQIKDKATTFESNLEHVLSTHKKLTKSVPKPPLRDALFDKLEANGYKKMRKFYYNKTRLYRIKRKILRMIN